MECDCENGDGLISCSLGTSGGNFINELVKEIEMGANVGWSNVKAECFSFLPYFFYWGLMIE